MAKLIYHSRKSKGYKNEYVIKLALKNLPLDSDEIEDLFLYYSLRY